LMDKNGEPMLDDKDRIVTRVKRHDVADFSTVIERYGLPPVLQDVDLNDANRPLLALAEKKDPDTCSLTCAPFEDEIHDFQFTAIKGVQCRVTLAPTEGEAGWRFGLDLRLGNHEQVTRLADSGVYADRSLAMENARAMVHQWLQTLPNTGNADQRAAFNARRNKAGEQIELQFNALRAGKA
jgi:hypothetical protein